MSETDTVYVFDSPTSTWLPASEFPVPNRAMNFGDGLFETMVFDGEKIRFFDYHIDRLQRGMRMLKIAGFGSRFLALQDWIKEVYPGQRLRIRWNVFRTGSGKYTPISNDAVQTLHIQVYSPSPQVKPKTSFSEQVVLFPFPWSPCKTLNALPYVLAAQEREERKLNELILTDHKGSVAEASSSNIFWRKGRKIFTPALECGCIAGVARRAIMEKVPRMVTQGVFRPNELLGADQVWVSNVTGISYLEKIDSMEFSTEIWEPLLEIFE
jgi:branched-subunit amino acid aminotransferase/4-amino-4-deoxychorismate lyase